MDLHQFCSGLSKLELNQSQVALAILWFHDEKTPDVSLSAGALSKIIFESGLGSPHSTRLGDQIRKSGLVISSSAGFRLKALARSEIREWLHSILGATQPKIDQALGYLPSDVWKDTR